jgi:hypothetical protein
VDSVATDEEKVSVKFKGKRTIVEKREVSNDVYAWGQGAPPPLPQPPPPTA